MNSKYRTIFLLLISLKLIIIILVLYYQSFKQTIPFENEQNQSFFCEFENIDHDFEANEAVNKIAFDYINRTLNKRMPIYNKCTQSEDNNRKDLIVTISNDSNRLYKIELIQSELMKRIKINREKLKLLNCFMQSFEKRPNQSESNNQVDFDKKVQFNSNFEVTTDKHGYFQVVCVDTSKKPAPLVYDDIFLVLPENMTKLIQQREKYKRLVEDFREKKVYPKVNSLINSIDYSLNCSKNRTSINTRAKPNILILGIDSVSLKNFKRIFPQTFKYLNNLEDNIIFTRMNSAGTSTIDNMIQMLTGLNRDELNRHLDKKIDDSFVDYLPFIWDEYESRGYLTLFQEDLPKYSIFNYLRKGFRYFPTHFYARGFWTQFYKIRSNNDWICHRSRPTFAYFLENIELILKQMSLENNRHIPYFSFNWLTEYTHDYIDVNPQLDVAIKNMLYKLEISGYFKNTILFFLSDHGNKLTSYSSTENGKKERISPLLSVRLPKSVFSSKYHENFAKNKDKLVSFVDIYQTLKQILFLSQYELNEENEFCENLFRNNSKNIRQLRGTSLFEEISSHRLCSDVHITDSYCSCFKSISITESQILKETKNSFDSIGVNTLNYIKNITKAMSVKCLTYSVEFIGEFKKIHYSKEKIIYSGQILLQPGEALFQINLKLDKKDELVFNDLPIRLSKYGNQSHCIYDRDLQNYCYCK
jgi:hypothetical protein